MESQILPAGLDGVPVALFALAVSLPRRPGARHDRQGSFYPLRRGVASAKPLMFAYVLDTPEQREALQEEILERIAAIQALSETVASAQLEAHDARSHSGVLDALAILSRDVRELMEASFHPGP